MIALVAAPGCLSSDPPPDLPFPPRADALVLRVPDSPADPPSDVSVAQSHAGLAARGGVILDPASVWPEARVRLQETLSELFGSPAAPRVVAGGKSMSLPDKLGLTSDRLAAGLDLYKRHCARCHGAGGDGNGATAQWVQPRPRDFRAGLFKFVSADAGSKPSRDDLLRTLRHGLPGTAMPSFRLLDADKLGLLADAVVYLSLRGQVEYDALRQLADGDWGLPEIGPNALAGSESLLRRWADARRPSAMTPPEVAADPDAVRRGWRLFTAVNGCASCHEDFGRRSRWRYDAWGYPVKAADLTAGLYKGGGSAVDLWRRVRYGIAPSGMPSHPALTEQQARDTVAFVQALARPDGLPPDVRSAVAGRPGGSSP